jgi:hypothetical protein
MLAAVLIIVAIAIVYVMGAAPSISITGTAALQTVSSDRTLDNITFTPTTMTYDNVATGDWRWSVYRAGVAVVNWQTPTSALEKNVPEKLVCGVQINSGDELHIEYKTKSIGKVAVVA